MLLTATIIDIGVFDMSVTHWDICDNYENYDINLSALLPAVCHKQVYNIFLRTELKPGKIKSCPWSNVGHAGAFYQVGGFKKFN